VKPQQLRTLYRRQTNWFADERNRLLRRVGIGRKRAILDLGAGTGESLAELRRRSRGFAVGLDADPEGLRLAQGMRIAALAQDLPFPTEVFDLVFTQMFFLWAAPFVTVISEVRRVLLPGGHLIAVAEPDYGGAIEFPESENGIQGLADGLTEEGADVQVGRKLGSLLRSGGFRVACHAHAGRPLEAGRSNARFASPELWQPPEGLDFLHIPHFSFLAEKPS
jgi:SAM-dependent methyltransferase